MKVVNVLLTHIGRLIRLALIVAVGTATLTTAVVVVAPHVADLAAAHRFEVATIDLDTLSERSYVYDRHGQLIATFVADQNRVQVPIENVPRTVVDSVLAAEDSAFYSHKGVNLRSIGRAFTVNLESGRVAQGGSTISQQIVKNIVGDDRTFDRKVQEAVLAVELEKRYTKNEILEHYLNSIYFGAGAYGVQAAAEVYFGKDVSELSWSEGALIAGLIRCPVSCDVFRHPALGLHRRNTVLDSLVMTGRLERTAADLNKFQPLPEEPHRPPGPDDYFVAEVRRQLIEDPRLGDTPTARYRRLYGGGLRIHTTLDRRLYLLALAARNDTLPENSGDGTFPLPPHPVTGVPRFGTAAMAGVEPRTGAVRFIVGGPGFDRFEFDLALQANRQVGSSFKTFVLAQALLGGASPDDLVDGSGPCRDIPGYPEDDPPGNYGGGRGRVATLASQTLASSNCAFLRLNQIVGPEKVAALAQKMGVTTELNPAYASMALGAQGISPLDMAAAYSVLANDGMRHPAYFIDRVENADGSLVFAHQARPTRVLPANVARLVTDVLERNVRSGTGRAALLRSGQPAAGKTGTTNNAYNVWFVGYTPQLSVSVWMGATAGDVRLSFGGGGDATGGRYPAATWGAFMNAALEDAPVVDFPAPTPVRGGRRLCLPEPQGCSTAPVTSTTTRSQGN